VVFSLIHRRYGLKPAPQANLGEAYVRA